MTQYDTLNIKLSNSQLKKLKSGIKNGTEVTLKMSLNVVGEKDDEICISCYALLFCISCY